MLHSLQRGDRTTPDTPDRISKNADEKKRGLAALFHCHHEKDPD
jgi:hypothetical protein